MNETYTRPITFMPLSIVYNQQCYNIDVRGKVMPSGKFFTCEIKGAGIFILEAIANPLTKKYNWVADTNTEYSYLMPLIKQEIEKQMRAA